MQYNLFCLSLYGFLFNNVFHFLFKWLYSVTAMFHRISTTVLYTSLTTHTIPTPSLSGCILNMSKVILPGFVKPFGIIEYEWCYINVRLFHNSS